MKRTVEIIVELTKKTGRDKNSSISLPSFLFSSSNASSLVTRARTYLLHANARGTTADALGISREREKKWQFEEREREREREFSFHEKTQKRRNLKTKVKRGRPLEIAS